MAIQISGTTVIDDSRVLSNISNTDNTTRQTINDAIVSRNNVLTIYNAAGTAVAAFYCANN